MHDDQREPLAVPQLDDEDMAALLAALAGGSSRVERCQLRDRTVWIKRYERLGPRIGQRLQWLASRLTGVTILRPAPLLDPQGMLGREVRQINAFSVAGFKTPQILYRGATALVLSHLGVPVSKQMSALRDEDADAHDALLVRCAAELGRLHAARLCHGRPHPRDFIIDDGAFCFLDFEEEPAAVMPLATAQARDVWLLFLQIASRALKPETPDRAFAAWKQAAPAETAVALSQIMPFFTRLLPLARFLLRIQKGHDLVRFVAATDYLAGATQSQS